MYRLQRVKSLLRFYPGNLDYVAGWVVNELDLPGGFDKAKAELIKQYKEQESKR